MSFGPTPLLTEVRKNRIRTEFLTFQQSVVKASAFLKQQNPLHTETDLWYTLLTTEHYYQHCKHFLAFAVKFLNRSFNETIVESEVSCLENIEGKKRPLKHENSVKLNFISTNGPHPLVNLPLVRDFLTAYVGKDWHFTSEGANKWFTSKVVDRHFERARNLSIALE